MAEEMVALETAELPFVLDSIFVGRRRTEVNQIREKMVCVWD